MGGWVAHLFLEEGVGGVQVSQEVHGHAVVELGVEGHRADAVVDRHGPELGPRVYLLGAWLVRGNLDTEREGERGLGGGRERRGEDSC